LVLPLLGQVISRFCIFDLFSLLVGDACHALIVLFGTKGRGGMLTMLNGKSVI